MDGLRRWLRRSPERTADTDELVTIGLGTDLTRANLVAEACRARGLHVELLASEMGAHPGTAGVEQRLLVRSHDVDAVREVVGDGGHPHHPA
jgi:hypothetical protein